MTEDTIPKLAYGSYHLPYDPEQHLAAYGARLIYNEVRDGSKGVVYNRQAFLGEEAYFRMHILPALDLWYEAVLEQIREYQIDGASEDVIFIENRLGTGPLCKVVGSPQGSHGYLYVTAVAFKEVN